LNRSTHNHIASINCKLELQEIQEIASRRKRTFVFFEKGSGFSHPTQISEPPRTYIYSSLHMTNLYSFVKQLQDLTSAKITPDSTSHAQKAAWITHKLGRSCWVVEILHLHCRQEPLPLFLRRIPAVKKLHPVVPVGGAHKSRLIQARDDFFTFA
jgi:hypothetical protein